MTREEAIKRIKTRFNKWALDDKDLEAIQNIVPELTLTESEDEKIRKFLVDILSHGTWRKEWPFGPNEVVAYLEKQKEQKPVEFIKFDNEFDNQVSRLLASVLNKEHDYTKDFVKYAAQSLLEFAKREQNPLTIESAHECLTQMNFAEWSEEDEENINTLIEVVHERMGLSEKRKQYYEKWLKSKSLRHQPNLEWTEEDKRKLNRIYEILGYAADDKGFLASKRIIGDNEAVELQDFLKSLRPQPHTVSIKDATKFGNLEYERGVKDGIQHEKNHQWKPEAQQLDCLRRMINVSTVEKIDKKIVQDLLDKIESL